MKMAKKNLRRGLLILVPLLIAGLVVGSFLFERGEEAREAEREAPPRPPVRVTVEKGVVTLTVDAAMQERSGIETALPGPAAALSGPDFYGSVLDLQPLAELASRRAAGAAEVEAAAAAAAAARAEAERVQTLYDDAATASLKALEAARAASAAAAARARGAQAGLAAVDSALRQQYGPALSAWARSPAASALAPFLAQREVLLRIVLPPGRSGPAPARLEVGVDGAAPVAARLVSAAPQVDPGLQGEAYFYRAGAALAAGLRVSARAAAAKGAKPGLLIPAAAIVWYGGQPWAYVRSGATRFERRPVDARAPQDGGFVVSEGFTPDERIVVGGAQLLLSEEARTPFGESDNND